MHGKNRIRKSITLLTALAVWCLYSTVIFAAPKDITGEISVTGQVSVNGQAAVSNSTVISGSTIVTGSDSSAVVSLGKLGRVELSADSSLTLKFTDGSITGILSQGKTRVSNEAGVATTFTTKDATVIADAGQANSFVVEVECSHSHVDTISGLVTMRTGSNDKQVAAGTTALAGNLQQTGCKPCMRPNSAPPVPVLGLSGGAIAAILAAAAVGVGAAVFFGSQNDNVTFGGNTTVISPTR
ncbi:MAG TPA: hypothetical protein VGC76_07960 [Pyrinomonadaceae bacterium]|jgi:hypothetical protein